MTTDLTGIQVTSLHGLLQNEGMAAPNITELHTEYQQLAAVDPYYVTVANIANIPISTVIGNYTGTLSAWDSLTTYNSSDLVAYASKAYQAVTTTTIGEAPDGLVGQTEWVENTDPVYRTYAVAYTVTLPNWIRSSMLQIAGNAGVFLEGFSQVLSNTVISSATTVDVNLLNRKVFYTLAEDFPVMVGSTPQQFISSWGDGVLIERAWARTDQMFPSGQGCRLFASLLNQAQSYAQKTRSIYTSAAQSTFGSDASPVTGGTGGITKLAGNDQQNLKLIGGAMFQSGALIDPQAPWVSYSAINVLNYLYKKNALYVGNLETKVFSKTFVDPITQRPQLIYTPFIEEKIAASNSQNLLYKSVIDRAVAEYMNQVLDSADVQQIASFMAVSTAQPLNTFFELLNPNLIWAPVQSIVSENTGKSDIVEAITQVITQYMRIGEATTATELGSVIANLQPIPGVELSELTNPTSDAQFQTLLNTLGTGSGENGSMRCEDCLGQTNYNEVLALAIQVLRIFHNGALPNATLQPAVDAMIAVKEAAVAASLGSVTIAGWTGYTDWAVFLIDVKNAVDPVARTLRDYVQEAGLSLLLMPYNRLAETHNTSTFVYTAAPMYTTVPTGIDVILGFLTQLSSYGKNEDQFDAQQIIEDCCVSTTVTGQAVIAVVREGYNLLALSGAGVGSDANGLSARTVPVPETGVGLIGGGAWPAPTDPYAN